MKKIKILPKKDNHKGPVVFIEGKQIMANQIVDVKDDVAGDLVFRGKAELVENKKSKD